MIHPRDLKVGDRVSMWSHPNGAENIIGRVTEVHGDHAVVWDGEDEFSVNFHREVVQRSVDFDHDLPGLFSIRLIARP